MSPVAASFAVVLTRGELKALLEACDCVPLIAISPTLRRAMGKLKAQTYGEARR